MSNSYVPRVGDRVRLREWGNLDRGVEVVAVTTRNVAAIGHDGRIDVWNTGEDWIKVEPDHVTWMNVYEGSYDPPTYTREQADAEAVRQRLGVVEINNTRRTATWHDVEDCELGREPTVNKADAEGGTATAGVRGTATAGDEGTATAGDGGTATAGYRGTAAAGDWGTAAAGDWGTAAAGDWGTAAAGVGGTATAGVGGVLIILHWDITTCRYRKIVGRVDGEKLLPGVAYRLNAAGEFEAAIRGIEEA